MPLVFKAMNLATEMKILDLEKALPETRGQSFDF